jgi:hypothetical protein
MEFEHRGGDAPKGEPTPSEAKRPYQNQPILEVGEGRHGVPPPQGKQGKPHEETLENQQSDTTPQEESLEEFRKALKRLGSKDKPPEGFSEEIREEIRRRYPEKNSETKG